MSPGNFAYFLPVLTQHEVRYVLIGGGAAIAHGLARTTYDVDIVYDRAPENLVSGLNFTLTSTQGDIDLLGEAAGNGTWQWNLARAPVIDRDHRRTRSPTGRKILKTKKFERRERVGNGQLAVQLKTEPHKES